MEIAFRGETVVVTGAARGIGQAIARGFAERGAVVWASDLLEAGLKELRERARPASGGRIETRIVDGTDRKQVQAFVAEAEGARKAVDVLVHVAGGVRGQRPLPIEEVSEEAWREIYDANMTGAFISAQAVVPGMKRAKAGRIVVISSRAGLGVSLTNIQSYATAKAAQIGFVRQLAHELGPFGITVNAIAPGFMRTSPDYERQWQSYGPEGQRRLIERIAMRRIGEPEDIAYAVLFLASRYASWITGQVLPVTGGPQA